MSLFIYYAYLWAPRKDIHLKNDLNYNDYKLSFKI